MNIYAINNDLNQLLLVDSDLQVINGHFEVMDNNDGTVSLDNGSLAYFVMQAPVMPDSRARLDYNKILNEAQLLAEDNFGMLTGG